MMNDAALPAGEKIRYLDGLRGLAAMAVVLAHLINGFYPALYSGDPRQAHHAWEVWVAGSPFNMVAFGNCFVCIFFILSGYVLAYTVLGKRREGQLAALAVARYVRLTIPILAAGLFTYALLKGGFTGHVAAAEKSNSYWWLSTFYLFEPDLQAVVKESLYYVYQSQTDYNPSLWTMRIELLGSFMVFSILMLCRSVRLRVAAYLLVTVFFFDIYYVCFIAGMAFHDFRDRLAQGHARHGRIGKFNTLLLLLAGMFLGAYPMAYTIGTWYEGLAGLLTPRLAEGAIVMAHFTGALLLMLAVERSATIRRILCGKVFQFCGRNAYSIYLLHLILIVSLFSLAFNRLAAQLPYDAACLLAAFVYLAVLMAASNVMYYCVDRPSVRLGHAVVRTMGAAQDRLLQEVAGRLKKVRPAR